MITTTEPEPDSDSTIDSARDATTDSLSPEPDRRQRSLRVVHIVATGTVIIAVAGGAIAAHLHANTRAENAKQLGGKTATVRQTIQDMDARASALDKRLDEITQQIEEARTSIQTKEAVQ